MTGRRNVGAHVLHADLSHAVIGCAMAVHTDLGPGWDEWDYHRALESAMKESGLDVASKVRGQLRHRDVVADEFELDLWVERKIILELKHLRHGFPPASYTQIIGYQKFWGMDLGILINFGLDHLFFERVPFTPRNGAVHHTVRWDAITGARREKLDIAAARCIAVFDVHGLGYAEKTYRRLLRAECLGEGLGAQAPTADPHFRGEGLGVRPLDDLLLDNGVMLQVTAGEHTSRAADSARLRSHMKHCDAEIGLLANFGRNELQLRPQFRPS